MGIAIVDKLIDAMPNACNEFEFCSDKDGPDSITKEVSNTAMIRS